MTAAQGGPAGGRADSDSTGETPGDKPSNLLEQDSGRRTPWPLIAAAAVVGVILAAVLLTSLTDRRDAGADRVIQAVQAFVAAHNGADEARKKETECAGGFDAGHSPFAGKPGRVGLISVTEPHVDGPRATARVTVEPEHGDRHTSVWRLIDTNGNWRVCTFS